MATSILKSDIVLVTVKTSLEGGVHYDRRDIETERTNGGGEAIAKWETTRVINDPAEHVAAVKVRGKAGSAIRVLCARTDFGLLCTETQRADLEAAKVEAKRLCEEFNATAKHTKVHVYISDWVPARSDGETARGIAAEIAELLTGMQAGIAKADIEAIRDAADRAKRIGAILDDSQAAKVTLAVESARKAAREITKRVAKDGEAVEKVLADLGAQKAAVEMARFAFLDLVESQSESAAEPVLPGVDVQRFAGLDTEEVQ